MPEDLEVPAIFRNLDMSLRVILNETRVLRQTMEDVERQVAVLQGEMADVHRTLHQQPSSTSRASSPAGWDEGLEGRGTASPPSPGSAPAERNVSGTISGEGRLGRRARPAAEMAEMPSHFAMDEDESESEDELDVVSLRDVFVIGNFIG